MILRDYPLDSGFPKTPSLRFFFQRWCDGIARNAIALPNSLNYQRYEFSVPVFLFVYLHIDGSNVSNAYSAFRAIESYH